MKITSLCWSGDILLYVPRDLHSTMRQTNDIDDAVNDVIMVDLNGQN